MGILIKICIYIIALVEKLAFQSGLGFDGVIADDYLPVFVAGLEQDCGLAKSCEVASWRHIH